MQVFVKISLGKIIRLEVKSSDTIESLRKQIKDKEGLDFNCILFSG